MSLYLDQWFLNVVCRALRANQKMSQLLIFIPRISTALPAREHVVSPSPANELDFHILTCRGRRITGATDISEEAQFQ